MDALAIILSALAAGGAASTREVTAQAVKDAYSALKALVVRRFGNETDLATTIERLEKNPDSKPRLDSLREELQVAGAGSDMELVSLASGLLDILKANARQQGNFMAILHGSGAIAQGVGAVAAAAGGVVVGGGEHGAVTISSSVQAPAGNARVSSRDE
jgi:hypothetical protein